VLHIFRAVGRQIKRLPSQDVLKRESLVYNLYSHTNTNRQAPKFTI
jgi:hypothetical protein